MHELPALEAGWEPDSIRTVPVASDGVTDLK